MSGTQLPPPARIPFATVQGAKGPVEVFVSAEWARYLESLNTLTNNTATGPGGVADINADDAWHDDLDSREAIRRIDALETLVADYRPPVVPSPAVGGSTLNGAAVLTVPATKGGVFEHEESFAAGVTAGMRVFLSLGTHSDSDENNERELSISSLTGEAGSGTIAARLSFTEQTSGPIRIIWMAL